MHYFSTLFGKDLLSIIRSLNTVFTSIGICHTGYIECLLARSGRNYTECQNSGTPLTPMKGGIQRTMWNCVYIWLKSIALKCRLVILRIQGVA